jgi:hypothetical protein
MVAKSKWVSIQEDLDAIREKAPRPAPPPIEEYLKAIYQTRHKWTKSDWMGIKKYLRARAKTSLHRNVGRDSFRIIIALTSQHAKAPAVSKYMSILKYARKQKFKTNQLLAFYKKHGSLNKCVAFIRKQARSRKKRRSVSMHARNLGKL